MRTFLKIISIAALSVIVSIATVTLVERAPRAGSTITTINGSDNIRNAPTTLNTNFTNLNSDKIEVSTTTLPKLTTLLNLVSVGTITTGTWTATAIGVTYGGTGTTSPTSNLLMLGNAASGLKTVNGFGTSGQFLTSAGAGVAPTWTSNTLDTTLDFNWTGKNYFKQFNASSTIAIGGVSYVFPAVTLSASSSILMSDGNNNLSWNSMPDLVLYQNSPSLTSTGGATSTLVYVQIPTAALSSNNRSLRVTAFYHTNASGGCWADIEYGYSGGTTSVAWAQLGNSGKNQQLTATIMPLTTNTQYTVGFGTPDLTGSIASAQFSAASSSITTSGLTAIGFGATTQSGGCLATLQSATVELLTR